MQTKAIVLLSGGLDSTTCLALAQSQKYDCYALSFAYGQRHVTELHAATRIAQTFNVKNHHIIKLDPIPFQRSVLTDTSKPVPDHSVTTNIAPTYVPARNTLFLSYALAYAETIQADHIFIGVSSVDYSGYPDCRPEFITAFQNLANLATQAGLEGRGITINAPLMHLSKAETIELGHSLNVDYSLTVSCYQANEQGQACGRCDSCGLRKQGFDSAKIQDPTHYQ